MWVRILVDASNARGVFQPNDEVCWPAHDAQPLVDTGAAVEIDGPTLEDINGDGIFDGA